MAQFRKRPVVIEAMQFDGTHDCACQLDDWSQGKCQAGFALIDGKTEFSHQLLIHTLEGLMVANPGDWIISGIKGEFYPVKPEIFAATYEPVE